MDIDEFNQEFDYKYRESCEISMLAGNLSEILGLLND